MALSADQQLLNFLKSQECANRIKPVAEAEMKEVAMRLVQDLVTSGGTVYGPRGGRVFDPSAWLLSGVSGNMFKYMAAINYVGDTTKASFTGVVYNVLGLYSKGWNTSQYSYGSYRGGRARSVNSMAGNPFIRNAVNSFNSQYASVGYVAEADAQY